MAVTAMTAATQPTAAAQSATATQSATAAANALHTPVMLAECLDLLAPALESDSFANPVLIDCTLGMGATAKRFCAVLPACT